MIRVYKRAKWVRPPTDDDGEYPLTDDRRRYAKPLVADGTPDDPDEFDVFDRVPIEFPFGDEEPSAAGKRAKKIERLLAETDSQVEIIDDGDT